MNKYYLPTRIVSGSSSLKKIGSLVEGFSPKTVLLVTGRAAMKKSGITGRMIGYLKNYKIIVYDKVEPNPTTAIVDEGLELVKKENVDLIISLGGGSAIDAGKAIAILARNEGSALEYLSKEKEIKNKGLPFIAIPTTAGTGSEITIFSVLTVEKDKAKKTLAHPYMYPAIAVADASLTLGLDKKTTAITGMDALSHAMEAYWSIHSFPAADEHAIKSIKLVDGHLEKACFDLTNLRHREKMMEASLEAGKAFSQTRTTAVHSVSYPMTSHYNVPHGLACGLTLAAFLEFNYKVSKDDCMDKRGPDFVKKRIEEIAKALGSETVEQGASRIREIMKNIGLPIHLKEAGVKDIDVVIEGGFTPERVKNNPRRVSRENLRSLLSTLF